MVFSVDDRVLIKLLRQVKGYGAKKYIAVFLSKPWTLLGLLDTSRFGMTFITKAAVTVHCVSRLN